MKCFIRTLIPLLLAISLLVGCDQDESIIEPTSSNTTKGAASTALVKEPSKTTDVSGQPTKPQIGWHPEILWTPLSLDAEKNCLKLSVNENGVAVGKYGTYDENGVQNEIAAEQKIAFGMYVDMAVEFFEVYEFNTDPEFRTLVPSEELYESYREKAGAFGGYALFEDWLEEQGFEVIRDHARHYSFYFSYAEVGDPKEFHYPPQILVFANKEQIMSLKSPMTKAYFHIYGASVEDFAPPEG